MFDMMSLKVDEDEHSIEMHLPYIRHALADSAGVTIVPILVGSLTPEVEREYGRLLAPYLDDPSNFFVVSSDFCHWGSRFQYQPFDKRFAGGGGGGGAIYEYIQWLDEQGMALIAARDTQGFTGYLRKHRNTICGRHPIALLLNAMDAARTPFAVDFVAYEQSSQVMTKSDSSVSYASAVVTEAG